MADELVPTVRTPMAPAAVYAALASAWTALLGTQPTRAELLVLLAQWAHETGGGGSADNWNLAGIKHTTGDGHDYAEYYTHEIVDGRDVTTIQRFRVYATLNESAFDYLRTLRRDFGFAWPAVESGDVADFGHRLKIRNYYTAPESLYVTALERWRASLDASIPTDLTGALANGQPALVLPEPLSPEVPDEPA
jgi:hypothetical protein